MSSLFDDIDDIFIDDESEDMSSIIHSFSVKNIAEDFIKHIKCMFKFEHYKYEIIDNKIIVLLSDATRSNNIRVCNGVSVPYKKDDIEAVIVFDSNYDIELIWVPTILCISYFMDDSDYYVILFTYNIFKQYGIITKNIVYDVSDIKESFSILTLKNRIMLPNDIKLSNRFCKNFPVLLNNNGDLITETIYIYQTSFEDETSVMTLVNKLNQYGYKQIYYNCATNYVNGYNLVHNDKYSEEFYKYITSKPSIENIDTYYKINENRDKMNKDFANILSEKIKDAIQTTLNEKWGDDFDPRHTNNSSYLKQLINYHYNKYTGKSSLYTKDRRGDSFMDIHVIKNYTDLRYPEKFGLSIILRTGKTNDNFRIALPREGKTILTDNKVDYLVFPEYEGIETDTSIGSYKIYNVYVFKKTDILNIYNNLLNIYENAKIEAKQKPWGLRKIDLSKLKDNFSNFLQPLQGSDGLCLSLMFLKYNAFDKYKIKISC